MNIKRVIHYQLFDLGKAFLIYYFIILSIILLGGGVVIISSGNATFNGTGFSSTVFCFIAGLCMFREYFYLFSQNGVSRKTTYIGTLSSITLLSALMSIIEAVSYTHLLQDAGLCLAGTGSGGQKTVSGCR